MMPPNTPLHHRRSYEVSSLENSTSARSGEERRMLVHELRASLRHRWARHFRRSRYREPNRGHRRGEGGVDSSGGGFGGLGTQPAEGGRGCGVLLDVDASGATITPKFSRENVREHLFHEGVGE